MAMKEYEIAFNLAAKLNSNFSKSFRGAGATIESLQDRVKRMGNEFADIGDVVKARKAVAAASKDYIEARKRVEELGKELSKTAQPTKKMVQSFDAAKASLDRAKKALERQRASLKNIDAASGTAGTSLQALIKRQRELEAATKDAAAAQERQAKIQDRISRLGTFNEKLGTVSGAADSVAGKAVAAGAAAGGAGLAIGGSILKTGADFQAAMSRIQASTGATSEEMRRIESSVRDIYKSGWGESFDDVARAVSTIKQVGGLEGTALEDAAKNALALSKTFDMDVSESTRAASALMKNFGVDGKKAYDIIAFSAQNGANRNGDLLDTLNEYSVQYKALGFSADQFAAHLIKGAQDGAFSIDKVGDAIKEFNIKAKDGSKTSMEAFDALGLSGTKATQMFAAGGASAQLAFKEVISRLEEMKDPVQKNAIGVALFGTQFEDLQGKALESLSSIYDEAPKLEGAMRGVSGAISKDLGTQISIVARSFKDTLIPASSETAKALTAQMPQINSAIASIAPQVSELGQAFVNLIPTFVRWGGAAISVATTASKFLFENFETIAGVAEFAAKAFIGFRGALLALQVATTVGKWFSVAQAAFVQYRVAALASAAASRVYAGSMAALSIAAKGSSAAMGLLAVAAKGLSATMKMLAANPVGLVLTAIAAAGVLVYKNWDKLKEFASAVSEKISSAWTVAMESIRAVFSGTFESLVGIVKAPVNTIIAMINSMIDSVNGMQFSVPDWVPSIGGQKFGVELPKIPQLAEGGIATKPTLATIAEAGEAEAVIPLSKLSTMLKPLPATAEQTGTTSSTVINFAPSITVNGGSSDVAGAVQTGLRSGYEEFKAHWRRLQIEDRRVSFV